MKNVISLIMLSLICITANSQNYLDYYHLICKAEIEIVDSNLEKSLENYQQAFDLVNSPFAKDYYNAALCAAKLKKDSVVLVYIEKLLQKGISIKKLKSNAFKHLYKTSKWKSFKRDSNDYQNKSLRTQNIDV